MKKIPDKVEDYLNVGERNFDIILTRIRHKCSSLKSDLFSVNIIPKPTCSCGAPYERVEHYFFNVLFITNKEIDCVTATILTFNVNKLVLSSGSPNCDIRASKSIILSVLRFIKTIRVALNNTA